MYNCNCTTKIEERRGVNVPVAGGANRIYFYGEEFVNGALQKKAMPNLNYAWMPDPMAVKSLDITNIVYFENGVSFDAATGGTLSYYAFTSNVNIV